MRYTLIIPGLVLLASLFGAVALWATAPKLQPTDVERIVSAVEVMTVTPRPVRLHVHSQGTVSPRTESALIPEVSGRIEWVSPSLVNGGAFDAGEALVRLESADYESTLARAGAALVRAEAELEHARFEFERLSSLAERQLVSRSQLENQQRALRVAEAAQLEARAARDQARRDLDRTTLTAPFAGLVRDESVDIGQFVSRGTTIATLYASQALEVRLPIADRQLAFLNLGDDQFGELPRSQQPAVTLSSRYAGRDLHWSGRIVRTEAQIDVASRMVHVVARVDNAEQSSPLRVGLFVEADIEGLQVDDVVVLPRSALREGDRVLIVDDEDRLRLRAVDLLRLYQDEAYIRAGLAAGERVCISPLQTAIEGVKVKPLTPAALVGADDDAQAAD